MRTATTTLMTLTIIETVDGMVPARTGTTMDVGSDVRTAHKPTHDTMYVIMHVHTYIGWLHNLLEHYNFTQNTRVYALP